MAHAAYLSTASTHNVFRGTGTYYGMTVSPIVGGSVAVMDVREAGATAININNPASSLNPIVHFGPFGAAPVPEFIHGYGVTISNGLTVSFASSMKVTVYYDD
jgi:hypothetical protein